MKIDLTDEAPDWPDPKDWPDETSFSAFINLAFRYSRYVLAPPILADRLRRMGDERASPREFECECPVLEETNRPWCLYQHANCRFAGSGAASPVEVRKALDDLSAPPSAQDGSGEALGKMIRNSANQRLACDLMIRICRRYLDADEGERAAMIAEMRQATRRFVRREEVARQARAPAAPARVDLSSRAGS